ncbi:MAG TPA: sugar ABC transporter permease [Phototrophicaceae bacterium]|nr:sugar ABC transporter permease [Phototrophicaceae bacterium]
MAVTASSTPATHLRRASWRRIRWPEQISAYLFLLPALIVFAIFAWYPMIKTVIFSFQNVSLNGSSTWVGFDNFQRMFIDPNFVIAWRNSLLFASFSLAMGFFVPIFISIMVNEVRRARGFFRLVYFLPTVIPITIALIIWRLIYNPDNGFLNAVLHIFHIPPQSWLQDPLLVKESIILILTWANFGSTMLIYLAALQDIPTEYYEASEIEGATPWQRIRYITFPHLRRTMVVTFILQIIAVVQIFTEPFLLTQGGPSNASLTPVLVIYRKAFLNNDFGLASAWSLSVIVILGVFSAIYMRITSRAED